MEIRITQAHVGRYNLLSSEETFSFYAGIYQDNKVLEVDGVKCMIHFSGEKDEQDNDWTLENLTEIFEKCLKYCNRIISTRDHEKEALTFAKVYHENYEEIDSNLVAKRQDEIKKKIERLQKELSYSTLLPDDLWYYNNNFLLKQIQLYTTWGASTKKEMDDTKEGSESYEKLSKKLKGYTDKIEQMSTFLLKEKEEVDN